MVHAGDAHLAERVERAGQLLARIILFSGATVLFAMLALTCADVFGRYILNAPVNGKTEITRFMMAGLIACALPVISVTGGHITVDLLDKFYSTRVAVLREFAVDLIMSASLFVLAYWLVFRADRLFKRNYVSDFLHLPLYPIAYFIALMTFVTAIALVAKLAVDAFYIRRPELKRFDGPTDFTALG